MLDKVASSPAGRALVAVILLLVILTPIGYSVLTRVTATGAESPERPDAKYTECIRDTEYMRFHHWELLKGLREKVVRDGIRGDLVDVETISGGEKKTMKVELCSACHPFYTGERRMVDTAGRVERFKQRYKIKD